MKKLKRFFAVMLAALMAALLVVTLAGCQSKTKIVIWTSGEDYKNDYYITELRKKFPEYNIQLEYMGSSTIAAKVIAEGDRCTADIIVSEEYGYLYKCEDYLLELTDFDFSVFLDDIVTSNKFTPELKNGGCVIINSAVLSAKNLPVPTSYAELTDDKYKGLISMPDPASSGTGYMFLRQLTNEWGEDEAFAWFEKLADNVLSFTSSGSGPVNALKQGEVGIGLGMTSQAVHEINEGVNLEIKFFEEGSPFSMYGNAILKKSADKEGIMDVFEYIAIDLCKGSNTLFFPDQIFKDFVPELDGYPKNIKYGNMKNDTLAEKERLLAKWTFA